MRGSVAPWIVMVACGTVAAPTDPTLSIEGASTIRVDHLGVVEGPRAVLSDGSEARDVDWSVSPDRVAVVAEGGVEAVAPGTAEVVGRWHGQEVRWTLEVSPPVALRFVDPPATVPLEREVQLQVEGWLEETQVEAGVLEWSTSDEGVLGVVDGRAVGRSVGTAYVTARAGSGSRATVQLQVIE